MDTEKFRQLIDHYDKADAGFESRQHWFRDEIGQESKPKEARNDQHCADQKRRVWLLQ